MISNCKSVYLTVFIPEVSFSNYYFLVKLKSFLASVLIILSENGQIRIFGLNNLLFICQVNISFRMIKVKKKIISSYFNVLLHIRLEN